MRISLLALQVALAVSNRDKDTDYADLAPDGVDDVLAPPAQLAEPEIPTGGNHGEKKFAWQDGDANLLYGNVAQVYPADEACMASSQTQEDCTWPMTLAAFGQYLWIGAPISGSKRLEHYKQIKAFLKDKTKQAKKSKDVAAKKIVEAKSKELSCNLEKMVLEAYGKTRPAEGLLNAICQKKKTVQTAVTTLREGREGPGWSVTAMEDILKRQKQGEELPAESEAQRVQRVWLEKMFEEALDRDSEDEEANRKEDAAEQRKQRGPGFKNIVDMERVLGRLQKGEELPAESEATRVQKAWLAQMEQGVDAQDELDEQADNAEAAAQKSDQPPDSKPVSPELPPVDAKPQWAQEDNDRIERIRAKMKALEMQFEKSEQVREAIPEMLSVADKIKHFSQAA